MTSRSDWIAERDYTCHVCGHAMALAPLRWVRVFHRKDGSHRYRILKGPR